jgi:rhodanese-related sulfurtransferase
MPEPRSTVEELLATARGKLDRLTPAQARAAQARGAALIDVRSESQRARDGELPGAVVIARNVLEWRLDPASPHRDPAVARTDRQVVIVCNEGYQSSIAAATVRAFGVDATDVIGGAQGWIAAGLPLGTVPGG